MLLLNGFRFFFYSNENNEPAHVHIMKGQAEGKIWLDPSIEVVYLHRFTLREEREIMEIVQARQEFFKKNGMSTLVNKYDSLESLIYQENLRIEAVDFHQELDLMLIVLNTKAILRQKLSSYPKLQTAKKEQLFNHEFIGNGTGIYWPDIDEDLSLKGFLQDELKNIVSNNNNPMAA